MKSFDIVIVGAGPAGMSAAIAARRTRVSVAVLDDNSAAGGQIWRGGGAARVFRDFMTCGAEFISGAPVINGNSSRKTIATPDQQVEYSRLILTTGARELFLPFRGWTLPGVCGVGGLQALVKSGLSVAGKRIVVAGSGPLLLAVAAYLVEHGARVPVIAEQASGKALLGFGRALLGQPGKFKQALQLKKSILGTSYFTNCWVTRAAGCTGVEEVTLVREGREIRERCDYLAVAYGFVANTELAELMGCELRDGLVAVDEQQQTSVPDIYCAGEPTGLGGVDEALAEGEIAGCAASSQPPPRIRKNTSRFTGALNRTFAPRPEMKNAVTGDTIICRCEDISFERLQQARNWREAKLHFRCGMGPCQGRICGPAVRYLFGWQAESVRPPIFPCELEKLVTTEEITY